MWNHYRSGKSLDVRELKVLFLWQKLSFYTFILVSPSHIRSFIYIYRLILLLGSFLYSFIAKSFIHSIICSFRLSFICLFSSIHPLIHSFSHFFVHFFIPLFTGSFLPYFYTESYLFNTLQRSTGDFGRSSHGSYFAVKSVAPKYAWRAKPNLPPKSQRKVRFTIPKSSQVSMIS